MVEEEEVEELQAVVVVEEDEVDLVAVEVMEEVVVAVVPLAGKYCISWLSVIFLMSSC